MAIFPGFWSPKFPVAMPTVRGRGYPKQLIENRLFLRAHHSRAPIRFCAGNFPVEPVSSEMRAGRRVDQLHADAHATAGFANGTFEDITHAQFAPDPPHLDRLALVREGPESTLPTPDLAPCVCHFSQKRRLGTIASGP